MYFRVLAKMFEIKLLRNITEAVVSSGDTYILYVCITGRHPTIKVSEDWNFLM